MYIPEHFRMPEADAMAILSGRFTGNLVSVDPDSVHPLATFLPWVGLDGGIRLISHMGRVNPQSAHFGPVLLIVMGPDAYVDPDWMKPGSVPTWDYETIHVYGRLTTHTDPDWIIQSWSDMMSRFSTQTLDGYDPDWLWLMAQAVTGLELEVDRVEAKSKLSQNRTEAEARNIADHLEPGCPALAGRIREVALPHIEAREERVRAAKPYGN